MATIEGQTLEQGMQSGLKVDDYVVDETLVSDPMIDMDCAKIVSSGEEPIKDLEGVV